MKVRPFQIAFSLFLAAAVLFNQVGLGYFHDKHDAHEQISHQHKNQTELHKHGEHCTVCSTDLFFSLFLNDNAVVLTMAQHIIVPIVFQDDAESLSIALMQGRAPPVFTI